MLGDYGLTVITISYINLNKLFSIRLLKRAGILFCLLTALSSYDILAQDGNLDWIAELTEEIMTETDLCERCQWVAPEITKVEFNNEFVYFLRYNCAIDESFAIMYDADGVIVSQCSNINGESNCDFGGNAFTIYTFAETIIPLWSCETGFVCEFAEVNGFDKLAPIAVLDTKCMEGIKILRASDKWVSYNWAGEGETGNESTFEITKNGTYSLFVQDETGCEIFGSITIDDVSKLSVEIKGPSFICANSNAEITAPPYNSYKWADGSSASSLEIIGPGEYAVTVVNESGCEGSASIEIQPYPDLDLSIGLENASINEGESINIEALLEDESNFTNYTWEGEGVIDCDTCSMANFSPRVSGELMLSTIDIFGCSKKVSSFVEVKELPLEVYTPNVLDPNAEGQNRYFTLFGGNNLDRILVLAIYDRWGNLIFNKKDLEANLPEQGWNGKIKNQSMPTGTYTYFAEVIFKNGKVKIFKGSILML